ncbi:uncharacterized protein Dwil_GK27522, partial [Drosophila willistoni]
HPYFYHDRRITDKLKNILSQDYGRYSSDELRSWLQRVRDASNFGINRLAEKEAILANFEAYDEERQDLEHRILEQIHIRIHDHLVEENKRCRSHYMRQKISLEIALKHSNTKKREALLKNSSDCYLRKFF